MKNKSLVVSTGLAMFSMFFGSGNLVFPLTVGREAGGHFALSSLGFLLTGVLVPFLGVLVMFLYRGETHSFFSSLGKGAAFWFSLCALSLMGPFGVLARCIVVAHGTFGLVVPGVSLPFFSILSCAVIFMLTLNKRKIVSFLGTYLTPILLLSLGAIVLLGLWHGSFPADYTVTKWSAFQMGFLKGYQTMDLLAAFFFSTFILEHLQKNSAQELSQNTLIKIFFKASVVGASLLSIIYIALVTLGTVYGESFREVPQEQLLGLIAEQALGSYASLVLCVAVVLACLTTAIVLASLFADFLRTEVAKEKISAPFSLLVTLSIAFTVSTFEFAGIAGFLGPLLEAIYPALITLTVLSIVHKLWGYQLHRWPIAATLATKVLWF
ncbi:branched-chain amino acid transport system II carrier protein [Parachlamydia sp. AcF125]|uniref:branched-chain amino acid transport system II carrier protein n=1 Tax=Parachlamydia sp. AcF125 TaxID=2795736 RepID=UPI001BC91261|nr:branched-chain amino acid transport system II carrier protein [Parachlamydia sp. AcF125]MBS4168058.1 Branched-chain amino acid transport system 2 carrier protein [Parachlamydia sp. AcF125]